MIQVALATKSPRKRSLVEAALMHIKRASLAKTTNKFISKPLQM
jgi:hypothetical protein